MSSFQIYSLLSLSLISLIVPTFGAECKPRAISVPFKSHTLATKSEVRGLLWQIGGPNPQNITLMPSAWYNETYLWGSLGYCPSSMSAVMCATYRGGLYDRSNSQTETDGPNMIAHTFDDTVANWTKDDVRLSDNTSMSQFEFAMRTNSVNSFVHKGEVGLAKSSTFMQALAKNEKTSSNSYSFFWGNEVTSEPRDGSLTLGGYDQALIADGANVTVPFADEIKCKEGIVVEITSLALQGKNVWEGLPELRVCVIAATSNIMSIPGHYWDPIQAAMGVELTATRNGTASSHFYNTTLVKPESAKYTGDMAITINGQSTVTIPNNQLLFDERYIATSGLIQTRSEAKQIPIVRIANGDGMMPRIGGMLFSSAVLVVNHDKREFTIAPAATKSAPAKIMAIDTANGCVGEVKVSASNTNPSDPKQSGTSNGNSSDPGSSDSASNSGNGSLSNRPDVSGSSSKALSKGAIAGIVVGVLAGLAFIIGAAIILYRRRHRSVQPSELAAWKDNHGTPQEKYAYHATEMYVEGSDKSFRHEMDGTGRAHEIAASAHGPAVQRV